MGFSIKYIKRHKTGGTIDDEFVSWEFTSIAGETIIPSLDTHHFSKEDIAEFLQKNPDGEVVISLESDDS